MSTYSSASTTVWYKQFWPWFIISIPASSIIVGMIQLYASLHSSSDLVKDDYYKEGLAINQVITMRDAAKDLGIEAHLTLDNLTGELILATRNVKAPTLTALFAHAALSKYDFSVTFIRIQADQYRANLEKPLTGIWNIYLESNNLWQLNGRINTNIHSKLDFNL
ncbi:FixH family protein [Marinomonas piezotolerans]|uniref:FixH family protein n=1 Tax=Marinomonas piezotolerans TaxID=2213058 RepID=UPI001314E03F|nr:FixH family protein [Marinomonas piezotolerans]